MLISTFGYLLLFPLISNGQTYSFRNYDREDHIPNSFVYTISQSDNGFLWIGTGIGDGVSRFDGYDFFNVPYPDSSIVRYPTVSIKDKRGVLWFGCSDGTVFYSKENKLIPVAINNLNIISDLIEGPDGWIYIIPQGKALFGINPDYPEEINKYSFSGDPLIYSASFTRSGNLLIGVRDSILVCRLRKDSVSVIRVVEGFDNSGVNAIHMIDDSTRFVIGTDDNGLFQLLLSDYNEELTRFPGHPEWESLNVQSIFEDSEKNLWISTFGSGVIEFKLSDNYKTVESVRNYNTETGLTGNDVKTVFQDIEGNYWFGMYGKGLSMLTSYAFSSYNPGKNSLENNILYVNKFNDKYILGTPTGFHLFDPREGKSLSFTSLASQVGKVLISSYYLDKEKNLWIGTEGNGLFVRSSSGKVTLFYRSGDTGADNIRDIETDGRNIWLATTNGVIVLDRITEKVKAGPFDISSGLPHNSINKILLTNDGTAYIGTESDKLYSIDSDFSVHTGKSTMYGSIKNKILSLALGQNGEIWAATNGNGIFEFQNDSVTAITRSNDLWSNYCYSILSDSEGYIWVGHDKGLSSFDPENGTMRVFGTDFAITGICNPEGMFESGNGMIFIGTTSGLIVYERRKDRHTTIPPFNNINYVTINDVLYPYQPSYTLPYSKYRITVSYSGINFNATDKVYYSTYLENFDNDWSKLNSLREVTYSLSEGKYKFNLISVNENGMSQEYPASFDLIIRLPFWRTWWFILVVILVVTGIVIFIIIQRDKAQKKIQDYLESELEARTSVVMKQKGEIELQNIEITDSINYAKRIQTSILPDIGRLKESFKDAFILFYPRDIVSGDFYWFDTIDEDKFILVCADSTGHGVPGAFMSMIGSTLLQDIVTRKRISKPSEILSLLDKQIFSTLNQNVELGVSNDGMDMVVCEFDVRTRHIRFASAMRPVIIVMDGESYYIKGNRSSIGGESVVEKFFDDQEYYLREGDTIYLFSDGLPDQFGGPDGKKLKIARLKKMIEKISKMPMDKQEDAMSKFYFEWKGNYDQVDDILLIGVKV